MKDLVRETGLTRETIHFYIAQGLLPPGRKTGRNTAEYDPEHLARLHRIRDLQGRHFLPLRAIKALLEEEVASENLTDEQKALLARVRTSMPGLVRGAAERVRLADLADAGFSQADVDELAEAGLVDVQGRGRAATVGAEDVEILRAWGAARQAGIDEARGFRPADLAVIDSAIRRLVREEVRRFTRGFADRPTPEATAVIERVMPLMERLLGVLHAKHIRRALEGLGDDPDGNDSGQATPPRQPSEARKAR